MNLIDRFKIAFGLTKANSEGDNSNPTGYEATGVAFTDTSAQKQQQYLQEMKGWVGAAVTSISDEVASIQLRLYEKKNGGIEEVEEHAVLDLLFRVNSFTTKFDHFWLTQSYLELTGEAPWFIERENGVVSNIFFLQPDKLKPLTGESRLIEGYEYDIGLGKKVKLSIDEVIFLKYPNPAKPFRGIGTLQMAAQTVDIDNFSEKWNSNFYQNSARPDSIMTVKGGNLSKEQKDGLKKSLQKLYQGKENAHKNMVLFGDIEFNKSGFSQKDMDFLEQQRFSRDKILGIFRVPKAIVSQTEGVNFASAKTAQFVFARYTIKPKMERLVQQLNEFLLPMFAGTENMFIDYDNPVPADAEEKIKKYDSALEHGWMTINEVREEQGLEPLEGGDIIYLPNTISPVDANGERPAQPTNEQRVMLKGKTPRHHSYDRIAEMRVRGKKYFKAEETKKEIKDKIKKALWKQYKKKNDVIHVKKEVNKKGEEETTRVLTKQEVDTYWEIKNAIYQKYRKIIEKELIKIFKRQGKSTLSKLSKQTVIKAKSDNLYNQIKLDEKKEIEKTLAVTFPIFEKLFKDAGDETFDLLQIDAEMDVNTDEIQKLLRDNGRLFAKGVVNTTNESIKTQVVEALGKGETIPEIKKRIIDLFDRAEEFRAERVARTETLRYNTGASEQAFKDSGIVEGKKWVTDPDPCEYCATLDGKTAGLGDNFIGKGDSILDRTFDYDDLPSPPLHPNCQCDIIPIFSKTKQKK